MTISDALHRLLLDNLTTATLLLNADLRLEYMNPAAEMLLASAAMGNSSANCSPNPPKPCIRCARPLNRRTRSPSVKPC